MSYSYILSLYAPSAYKAVEWAAPRQSAITAIHRVEKRGRQGFEVTFAASTFFAKLLQYMELWAGLLASGSSYSPRLPVPWDSG